MMGASRFNWCFIGTGKLANIVAKEILPSGRHRIAAVYTRNPQKCREFADQYGGVPYDSAKAAAGAPDVDGVYIVTPHTSHCEYAKLALSLGKPVLCEKPVTVTAPEAAELFALAEKNNVYLAEAMWTWFSPVAQKVKQWYDAGELGELYQAEATTSTLGGTPPAAPTRIWPAGRCWTWGSTPSPTCTGCSADLWKFGAQDGWRAGSTWARI